MEGNDIITSELLLFPEVTTFPVTYNQVRIMWILKIELKKHTIGDGGVL